MNKPSIAIGYIRSDMIDGPFMDSILAFLDFDSRNHKITKSTGFLKALYLDDKRNELIRDFLGKTTADYLMMVDSDMQWGPSQIYQLVDEAVQGDRAILSGLYFSWLVDGRLLPVWFSEVKEGGILKTFSSLNNDEMVVPLAACGMGFCLIRRDVFEGIAKRPEWASTDWTWFGRDVYQAPDMCRHMGEDTTFGCRAGMAGYQTWGHKGVQVGHWKKTCLDANLFRAMVEDAKRNGRAY